MAMSKQARTEPLVLPAGTVVTLESSYRAENHYGVMALYALALTPDVMLGAYEVTQLMCQGLRL